MMVVFIFNYFFYTIICKIKYAQKGGRKIHAKKIKSKKNQNTFKYDCKHVFRRCESYRMYFEGDSPH